MRRYAVCVSGGKQYSFFEKFGVFRFLVLPVLRFALSPYYRRNVVPCNYSLIYFLQLFRITSMHYKQINDKFALGEWTNNLA